MASDAYYEWYAQRHLKPGQCLYHLCSDEYGECQKKLPRGDPREVVHIQKWRLVNPLSMMEHEYTKPFALDLVRRLVLEFVPASRVPEPPGPPPPGVPGGPGGGSRADDTDLDRIARKAQQEADEAFKKESTRGSLVGPGGC